MVKRPEGAVWQGWARVGLMGWRETGAHKAHGPWTGAGIWSAAGVIGGFEAPVVTGSKDLHSNDI